ncbi:MAG TPA: glycosyltransferase family 4 protein [Clostridiaceae bacterium]|nr:glycosyltransferase family 4 protein [Clostridiaceae bacterium]
MISKTIWILNHYAISPDMAGGTRHHDLGKELVRKGCDVTIFASGFDHGTKRYIKISSKERITTETYNGVRFVWVNTHPYYGNNWHRIVNMASYGTRVLGACKGIQKPDVIIGSSLHPFAVLAGWWLAKRYKARFIFEVRDLWPQTAVDMGAMKNISLLARMLYAWEKFMYQRAEKIIVLLSNAKEYIVKRGIDPRKIIWIPNGVDLERFDNPDPLEPSSEAKRVFSQHSDKIKVVYAGAHGPANGLEVIIEAAKILSRQAKPIHFILIGDGPEKTKLIQKTESPGIGNISFLDPVPKSQIPAVLQQADILVHCLKPLKVFKYGISPNKLFDYLASGKTIIMSAQASDEIIKQSKAGICVEPGNPDALVEGILNIIQMDPIQRKQFGTNGRAYVERYHSIQVLGEKLYNILK